MTNKISKKEYLKLVNSKLHKANKYNAKSMIVDGIRFDSKKEANRYIYLKHREKAGEISSLKLQVPIFLEGQKSALLSNSGRQMRLTVDFSYIENASGILVYEDAKGIPTRDYLVRKSVANAMGIEVIET